MRRHTSCWAHSVLAFLVTSTIACGSQTLTESRGLALVRSAVNAKNDGNLILDHSSVARLLKNPTYQNIEAGTYPAETPEAGVQRLLRAGFVRKVTETLVFPDLTGQYRGMAPSWGPVQLTLSMNQGSAEVSGHIEAWSGSSGCADGKFVSRLTDPSTLEIKGFDRFEAAIFCSVYQYHSYVFKITSSPRGFVLADADRSTNALHRAAIDVEGGTPGKQVTVQRYTYEPSPDFEKLASETNGLIAGRLEVRDVSELLLGPTETGAAGSFSCHVELNRVAQAFTGRAEFSGKGRAEFGKQPDGNWVVTAWSR